MTRRFVVIAGLLISLSGCVSLGIEPPCKPKDEICLAFSPAPARLTPTDARP